MVEVEALESDIEPVVETPGVVEPLVEVLEKIEPIENLANELWDNSTIVFLDGSKKYIKPTNNPYYDFVLKTSIWMVSIKPVGTVEEQIYYHQISAGEVLKSGKGLCDEVAILYCSIMRNKDIPCKIVANLFDKNDKLYNPYRPYEVHAQNLVFLNGEWIKVDPSLKRFSIGEWGANGQDVTYKDTEWYSDMEGW